MRARGDNAAVYRLCELGAVANVSRHMMRRPLRQHDVQVERVGRTVLVPLSEIEEKVSRFWHSLHVVSKVHRTREREQAQRQHKQSRR